MSKFNNRVGESAIMNNGLKAKIIEYRNANDMDVEFECGGIVCNVKHNNFTRGKIRCPMIIKRYDTYAEVTNPNPKKPCIFLIDIEDLPLIDNHYWCNDSQGYITSKGTPDLHRVIMNAKLDERVDHKNLDKSDCRKHNLRKCIHQENCMNVNPKSFNTSGYKGVTWHKASKKWMASITLNYEPIYLGLHDIKKDAARAYNDAAIKYFGEFARLNDIS